MQAGAERRTGLFKRFERDDAGITVVYYEERAANGTVTERTVRGGAVIGADGALSAVARQCLPGAERLPYVFAYHEIVRSPRPEANFDGARCDVYYRGSVSPDFYGWVFPHGDTVSVGTGSACKGFSLRGSVGSLRDAAGLGSVETIRREGAPIPLRPLPRWDNGHRRAACRRCRGRRRAGLGRGHLLRHDWRTVGGGRGRCFFSASGDAKALRTARKTLHANAWRRVLDSRDDAMVLVFKRPAPRALCEHLP